jgi:type IV secretory pathway VirB4 component
VNTRNLADLLPTSSSFRGTPHDAQLAKTTGTRRAWLYTPGEPYRMNSDSKGGAAHTLVFGRTGEAGKSTLLNHLALQFYGWPKAQVISLSTGRSEYGPCLMSGGAVYAPGSRDEAALQPLAYVDQPDEAVQAVEWLEECVAAMGEPVTTEIRSALADMVKALGTEPSERRTMTSLVNLLGSRLPPLAEVLKPFSHYGMYGHIFDGKVSAWDWRPWTMIELAPLLALSDKVSGPALSHIFRRIYKRFDGRPTAVFTDEVPDWAHLPGVERQLIRILDTQRKNNVRLVLIAQTPGQLLKFPDLMKSVKSAATSRIYGPDSEALTQADTYREFGVNTTVLERIKHLQLGQYLHATSKGMRVFDLHAGPIALALTTMSSPEELAFLAELRANGCDGDEIVRSVLRRKGLEQRARGLGVWDSATTTALAAE